MIIYVFEGFEQKRLVFVQAETNELVRPDTYMSHFCQKIQRHKDLFRASDKNFYVFSQCAANIYKPQIFCNITDQTR